jgi:hypothetical protein
VWSPRLANRLMTEMADSGAAPSEDMAFSRIVQMCYSAPMR